MNSRFRHYIAALMFFMSSIPGVGIAQMFPIRIGHEIVFDEDAPVQFNIGNVGFVYRYEDFPKKKEAVTDLSKLLPPDRVLLNAAPNGTLKNLVRWQTGVDHHFEFVEAKFANYGEEHGYNWKVTWELFPEGGFSGTPYRYVAFVAGDGSIIEPQRYLWDAFPVGTSSSNFLLCKLDFEDLEIPDKNKKELYGEDILNIVKERLASFSAECKKNDKLPQEEIQSLIGRLKYLNQQIIEIPIRDTSEKIHHRPAWAVNFVDGDRIKNESDITNAYTFIVWVTIDGRVGEISITPRDAAVDENEN